MASHEAELDVVMTSAARESTPHDKFNFHMENMGTLTLLIFM